MFCGFLQADTIFQTGFERPTYSTGNLDGHDGWTTDGVGTVGNSRAFEGSQAVQFNSSLREGSYFAYLPLSYDSLTDSNQLVTVSDEFYITGNSREDWNPIAVGGTAAFAGQIVIFGGLAELGNDSSSTGSIPIENNQWNLFTIVFDFANATETGYVNGSLLGTLPLASGLTDLTVLDIGYNYKFGARTDQAFVDNVSITSDAVPEPPVATPEPATFTLASFGILAAFGFRRYKRT